MTRRVGIDVGGTKCLGVVIDADLRVVDEARVPTPDHDRLVDVLAAMIEAFGAADHVGVGVPGLVDRDGVIRSSPNIKGAFDLDVRGGLRERIGREVHVGNDATCAALAEWSCGAARGIDSFWMITLGTGIGGGLVVDGVLVTGSQGFAGEIGHMIVDRDGRPCGCGMSGCWERYASGSALVDAAGVGVFDRVRAGDDDARAEVEKWSGWVGVGLANLANATDPEAFVIGGGVVDDAECFIGSVGDRMAEATYSADRRRLPRVVAAQLGSRAGAIGAALLGRD